MAPSKRGLSAKLTGGVSYPRRHTPSTAKAVPLKVNCPEGAREATLGCPLRGGKGTVLTKVDKH